MGLGCGCGFGSLRILNLDTMHPYSVFICIASCMIKQMRVCRDARETIESGPLCITDLFKNKSVAYFLFITAFI